MQESFGTKGCSRGGGVAVPRTLHGGRRRADVAVFGVAVNVGVVVVCVVAVVAAVVVVRAEARSGLPTAP